MFTIDLWPCSDFGSFFFLLLIHVDNFIVVCFIEWRVCIAETFISTD